MRNKFIIILLCIYPFVYAQKNIGGVPYSFDKELNIKNVTSSKMPEFVLAKLDFQRLSAEDAINDNDSTPKPFRYGVPIDVNLNMQNSGEWLTLENGDRIWRLKISCPDATLIHLNYDRFWIPNGGVLYIYDKDKTSYIGGFNQENNRGTKEQPSKFATGLIYSDVIILEYFEPKEVSNTGIISITNVIYGYRDVNSVRAVDCFVNINCSPEGDDWQQQKKSVARLFMNGAGCTGSLINNTRNDGTLYFLTACHCIGTLDAITNPDASYFIFSWNYESQGCDNGVDFTPPSTSGATVIANYKVSDFALLQLQESPLELTPQVFPYLNGWDRQIPSGKTTCIHHPAFGLKKISIANDSPVINQAGINQ